MSHRVRLIMISVAIFAMAGVILSRLVDIQFQRSDELKRRAERQYQHRIVLTPKRGTIFDRRGRVLAINVDAPSVYAVPDEVGEQDRMARSLGSILGRPADELAGLIKRERSFVWLDRKITPAQKRKIEALGLPGIHFITESKRVYPAGRLASHLLGFAGIDNDGLAGLEYEYDQYLKGREGLMIGIRGAKRGYLFSAGKVIRQPTGGFDLELTLDGNIQFVVEEELRKSVEQTGAVSGIVVVMNHRSGAILAMASYPDYDPNNFSSAPGSALRNRAVVDAYEPGSTFKIVTASAAIEHRLVKLGEIIDCGYGSIQLGGRTIRDHQVFEPMPFSGVIEKSSNVGAIRVGLRVGQQRMGRMARAFGFGRPTGIDLPAENPGVLRPVDEWSKNSIGSVSIGQEVSGNAVHVILMAAAIANGGYWVRPYVVNSVTNPDGERVYKAQIEKRKVISRSTVNVLRSLMRGVVVQGTGRLAEVAGIPVAGKTGTAEVAEPGGGYIPGAHIASFVGFLPFENPQLTMLCVLNRPEGKYHGGDVAAPLFSAIGNRIVKDLELENIEGSEILMATARRDSGSETFRSEPEDFPVKRILSYPAAALVMPDLKGLSLRSALERLAELGVVPQVIGNGKVVSQIPEPGEPVGGQTTLHCGTGIADNN